MINMRLLVFFCVLCATTTMAHNHNKTSLESRLKPIHSLTADFTQEIYDNQGHLLQQSSGSLAIKQPGKLRWDIKQPMPQLMIINQNKTWLYDATLKQITIYQTHQFNDQTPLWLLSKQRPIHHYFNIKQQHNQYILTFKDSQNHTTFNRITLRFKDHILTTMRFDTQLSQYAIIHFHHVKINPIIDDHQFKMVIPRGTDVVQSP